MRSPVHSLPDELIKEILLPLFDVPDALFSNNSADISPFSTPSEHPCSTHLTVCKQWMRVATPLLYEVVILRSRPQAASFERALHKNPDFGKFVKRLRLEGGFGAVMGKILLLTTHIKEICLSLMLYSPDTASGLQKALHLVNPTRVILIDHKNMDFPHNQITRALSDKLCHCIMDWTSLKIFDFPYEHPHGESNRGEAITRALSYSPSIDVIHVPNRCYIDYLKLLSANANLRCIHVKGRLSKFISPFSAISLERKQVEADPKLKSLVLYDDEPFMHPKKIAKDEPIVPRPENPSYTPLLYAPEEVKERIWNRIFRFVMECDISSPSHHLRCDDYELLLTHIRSSTLRKTCLRLIQVSKLFHRVAEPYLYYILLLKLPKNFQHLAQTLQDRPSLATHIHFITIGVNALHPPENRRILKLGLSSILKRATNLVYLRQYGHNVDPFRWDWDIMDAFNGSRLVRLRDLAVFAPSSAEAFTTLAKFESLETLQIDSSIGVYPNLNLPRICLPKLETITFSTDCIRESRLSSRNQSIPATRAADKASLLDILSKMDLPSLRSFALTRLAGYLETEAHKDVRSFLMEHGPKLLDVKMPYSDHQISIFELCGHMRILTLDFDNRDAPAPFLFDCEKHTALQKVVFNGVTELKSNKEAWQGFFDEVDLSAFSSLGELQIPQCVLWPTNEREIRKNVWVPRAMRLRKEFDVKLTDRYGVHWVPRLGMR